MTLDDDLDPDDLDLLAPPGSDAREATDGSADDDPLAAPAYEGGDDDPEGAEESDGGFSDPEKVVRVWVEGGKLTKVRLSPVWFHKVPDAAGLEARFRMALMRSTLQPAEIPDRVDRPEIPAEAEERFRGLPELSRRSLAMFREVRRQMGQRHAAARADHTPPPPPQVTGRSKGVTVLLNSSGWAEQVRFDPKWLDDAQVGSICTHIMIAAERAYASYQPAPAEETVLDEMAVERELLRTAMLTLFTPRDKRR